MSGRREDWIWVRLGGGLQRSAWEMAVMPLHDDPDQASAAGSQSLVEGYMKAHPGSMMF